MAVARFIVWFNLLFLWKQYVRVWGNNLRATSLDRLIYLYLHRFGLMGRGDRLFFEQHLRPDMHVIDIGANVGLYTILFSRLVGASGSVAAFEPDPDLFEALETNCRINGVTNVRLYNLAAGSRSGVMVLHRSVVNTGDNRMSTKPPALTEPVNVRVATVDETVSDRRIDFIKIDVQGWEGEVVQGMRRLLGSNPCVQVYFEYWPYGLRKAGIDPKDLLSWFQEFGFQLYRVSGGACTPIAGRANTGDPKGKRFTNFYAVRQPVTETPVTNT